MKVMEPRKNESSKKERPPIRQLLQAGRDARKILEKKGMMKSAKESVVDQILLQDPQTALPGLPPYLPDPILTETGKWLMRDFLVIWMAEAKKEEMDNISKFFTFCLQEMKRIEEKNDKLKEKTVAEKIYDPKFQKQGHIIYDTTKLIRDSFILSINKYADDVPSYLDWWVDWTTRLLSKFPSSKLTDAQQKVVNEFITHIDESRGKTTKTKEKSIKDQSSSS